MLNSVSAGDSAVVTPWTRDAEDALDRYQADGFAMTGDEKIGFKAGYRFARLSTDSAQPAGVREAVARLVDDNAWHWHDRWLGEANLETMRGRADRLRIDAKGHVARSFAKADEILAVLAAVPAPTASVQRQDEARAREVLAIELERRGDHEAARGVRNGSVEMRVEACIAAMLALLASSPTPPDALPADVRALVIAGREFWDHADDFGPESMALLTALESFSSRVPYDDEPTPPDTISEHIGGVEGNVDRVNRPCGVGCNNPACCEVRCLHPIPGNPSSSQDRGDVS